MMTMERPIPNKNIEIKNPSIRLNLMENFSEETSFSMISYFLKYFDFLIPAIELTYDPISSIWTTLLSYFSIYICILIFSYKSSSISSSYNLSS